MLSRATINPLKTDDNARLNRAESDLEAGKLKNGRSAPNIQGPQGLDQDLIRRVSHNSRANIDSNAVSKPRNETTETDESSDFDYGSRFTAMGQIRAIFFNSWLNVLLLLVPVGFAVNYTRGPSLTTFLVNFFAIVPLSVQLNYTNAELVLRIGENWGGLAYITISNFVQIVSSILLLRNEQLGVLQTNLIGGILSSILLVLGLSIVFGGLTRVEQHYNLTAAHISANLLSLAATSLLIPTASHLLLQTTTPNITRQSRGAAVILLCVYGALLLFQFRTHSNEWGAPGDKTPRRNLEKGEAAKALAKSGAYLAAYIGGELSQESPLVLLDDRPPEPSLSGWTLVVYLISVTTLTAFCTNFAVDSIDALSEKANLSKPFIGLILLPILNNDLTPIEHAVKDDMKQTMNFTIGKCLQTALFVTPVMVIVAWGMGQDLSLYFDGFEVVSLFASVLLLNYIIIDGKSSWLSRWTKFLAIAIDTQSSLFSDLYRRFFVADRGSIAGLGSSVITGGTIVLMVYIDPFHRRPMYQGFEGAIFFFATVIGRLLGVPKTAPSTPLIFREKLSNPSTNTKIKGYRCAPVIGNSFANLGTQLLSFLDIIDANIYRYDFNTKSFTYYYIYTLLQTKNNESCLQFYMDYTSVLKIYNGQFVDNLNMNNEYQLALDHFASTPALIEDPRPRPPSLDVPRSTSEGWV